MKKILYFAAVLLTAIGITSCKDDEPELAHAQKSDKVVAKCTGPTAEYTICIYATSGGNLDAQIIQEFLENEKWIEETNGKVRAVGIYKASKSAQAKLGENGGTRYFELKRKDSLTVASLEANVKKIVEEKDSARRSDFANEHFVKDIINEKYADANFKMYDPDNIAAAFKFLAEKAPAKKYILLTNNHGGGWSFKEDKALKTRAMIGDDCLDDIYISLDQFNAGVKQSGVKFDALFCDLCLMATLENLYGYSENFPICIASAETTTYSYFGLLAKRLAKLGGNATHDQLYNECADWVTTTDTTTCYRKWETYKDFASAYEEFQDMGCYDLTKIGNLTTPLCNISNWFNKALADKSLKRVVEKSVYTTLYTTLPKPNNVTMSLQRQDAIQELQKKYGQNMTSDMIADYMLNGKSHEMYGILTNSKNNKVTEYYDRQYYMTYGYPMAYFVWNTERIAKDNNMAQAASELEALFNAYTTALKSMCRIKCSFDDFKGCTYDGVNYPAMDAYIWTSPTVNITSLSKAKFNHKLKIVDYSAWEEGDKLTLTQAMTAYRNTKFDKTTSWSSFLQQLDVNPNVITNFYRQLPVTYAKTGKIK